MKLFVSGAPRPASIPFMLGEGVTQHHRSIARAGMSASSVGTDRRAEVVAAEGGINPAVLAGIDALGPGGAGGRPKLSARTLYERYRALDTGTCFPTTQSPRATWRHLGEAGWETALEPRSQRQTDFGAARLEHRGAPCAWGRAGVDQRARRKQRLLRADHCFAGCRSRSRSRPIRPGRF